MVALNPERIEELKREAEAGDLGRWRRHWGITEWHPNDLRALDEGCYFDLAEAERVRKFFRNNLRLPNNKRKRGEPKYKRFDLLNWWYREVIGPLFGWRRTDGTRRFRKAYVSTAKKSGKTEVIAGLLLYALLADGEVAAEVYNAAVNETQAARAFKRAWALARRTKAITDVLNCVKSELRIDYDDEDSFLKTLADNPDSADGINAHFLLIDELHRWRGREMFEAIALSTIQRTQGLIVMITTAGDDDQTVCYEEYTFAKRLLDPEDDLYSMDHFAFIAEASEHRSWDDPEGWKEANPSIVDGLTSLSALEKECNEVRASPRKKRNFIRLICNRWVTDIEEAWISRHTWKTVCNKKPRITPWVPCFGGLDLSSVKDLSSLCLCFKHELTGLFDFKWWFWMPEDGIEEREEEDRQPYREYAEEGLITLIPGRAIDHDVIRYQITGAETDNLVIRPEGPPIAERYDLQQIAYDPYNATTIVNKMEKTDGMRMVLFRQGYKTMSPACKQFESAVLKGTIRHGFNPIMNWMIGNAVTTEDSTNSIMLNKRKSYSRIDGVVAAVMAKSLATDFKGNALSAYGDDE